MNNKDEENVRNFIETALAAINIGNYVKAEKLLLRAQQTFPNEETIQDLLDYIQINKPSTSSTSTPEEFDSQSEHATNLRHRKISNSSDKENSNPHQQHPPELEYTEEQVRIVQKIKKCKDYYEVLGVEKDATENDIKKAYKKLALQLHPDKNSAPGSSEAFKAVGNAVLVLTDTQKRKEYDLYGLQDGFIDNRTNSYRQSNSFEMRQHHNYEYSRGFESDISAEELFNMFFGGGFPQHRSRRYSFSYFHDDYETDNPRHYYNFDSRESVQRQPSLTFGIILLFIILTILTSFLTSDPYYSLGQNSKYNVQRYTTHLKVPYYVKENFENNYHGSLSKLENMIEENYIFIMKQNCYRERSFRESMILRAEAFGSNSQIQKAKSFKPPSCENLVKIGLTRFAN